ncbi:MAG: UDP-N-acetylmuramate--L-alanine ligase [Ktedonobacterales bacterium]
MDSGEAVKLADLAALEQAFPQGMRGKRIHAVGAGGHGIAPALGLAQQRGAIVTGCDLAITGMSHLLTEQGVSLTLGHDPAHVHGCDLVVTNPAVTFLHPHHPELVAAQAQGIPVAQWQPLLGLLMRESVGVSVAGVHGKGTTTALLGALAVAGGLDPTVEVGDIVRDWDSNILLGSGAYFINEADEFNYNFASYHPRMVVLTAVEYDHPEFFPSYEAIRDAFVGFLRGMDMADHEGVTLPPTIVLNADSPGCHDTLAQLGDWPGDVRSFSIERADVDAHAEHVVVDARGTTFTLHLHGALAGQVTLPATGAHFVADALAAAAAADALGVAPVVIVKTLSQFYGLRRRFEILEDDDVTFIDDYAHHPHAVALTLEAARQRFLGRRLIAVFQPTLYTRLHRFLTPFSQAFDVADEVVIVEIQPSRERDTGLIHGSALVEAIQRRPAFASRADAVRYGGDFAETAALLRSLRQPGDVIAVLGSGPVNQVIANLRTAPRHG